MNSDRPKGDAALIAAITTGAPVPTTEAQADELVRMELPKPDCTGLQQWFQQLVKAVAK